MSAAVVAAATIGGAAISAYSANQASKRQASAANRATDAAAAAQADQIALGREELAENKRQYDANSALSKQVVDAQLGIMDKAGKQADDYYDYMKGTFRPVEQSLVKDAMDFSTEAEQERTGRMALADMEQAQANEAAQNNRRMAAMGINPNSGRFQSMDRSRSVIEAAARAGAVTGARERARDRSFELRSAVSNMGRNLPNSVTSSQGMAVGAGSSALNSGMAPGSQYLSGMNMGSNMLARGGQFGMQGAQFGLMSAMNNPMDQFGMQVGGALMGYGLKKWGG